MSSRRRQSASPTNAAAAASSTANDSDAEAAAEADAGKWECQHCTYRNYPTAVRCTMCASSKPAFGGDIFDVEQVAAVVRPPPRDAAALRIGRRLSMTPPPPPPQQALALAAAHGQRRSRNADHDEDDESGAAAAAAASTSGGGATATGGAYDSTARTAEALHNDMNDQLRALSMRSSPTLHIGSDSDLSACGGGAGAGAGAGRRRLSQSSIKNVSPLGSDTQLDRTGSRSNLGAAASASARRSPSAMSPPSSASKWSCALCTYENYPKSQRCSMCGHPYEAAAAAASDHQYHADAGAGAAKCPMPSPERRHSDNSGDDSSGGGGGGGATNVASNYIIPKAVPTAASGNRHSHRYQLSSAVAAQQQQATATGMICSGGGVGGGGSASPTNSASSENASSASALSNCDNLQERRVRQLRRQADWQWLHACLGVVENNYVAVEAYLQCGGNAGRGLTAAEVAVLNRSSAFDVGHTLIHLAIRFHREEMLPMLLQHVNAGGGGAGGGGGTAGSGCGGPTGLKRVPSYVAPDLAADIRRHFAQSLRTRKAAGAFACQYVGEHATFALPAEIEELPLGIQEQLHEELLDRDAQAQLEGAPPALNWSLEITVRLGSRLMVLWNRSAGDCLLDSAMQATWGVFDREHVLRRALADSLHQCGHIFYARWKEYEMAQAALLHFSLEDSQWQDDWASLLALARQPGASLEQLHIFALAHILRRPIIVYGVKYVKSFRGESLGLARFEGAYLPLLWDQSFCSKSPIALGYSRGHFSALVPVEPYARIDVACVDGAENVLFLPLMDCEHKLLPIHFLTHAEMGHEESIMRQWLDVCVTEGGLLVAQQKLQKRPLLVAQMLEEWLNHYRRIAQVVTGPFGRRRALNHASGYSSDGDTDEE